MADELIQGVVVIDPEGGTVDAKYLVTFYPAPSDHRPCAKSDRGLCFEKALSEKELLDAFQEADLWLKYTPQSEFLGKTFMCVIRSSIHDRLLRP